MPREVGQPEFRPALNEACGYWIVRFAMTWLPCASLPSIPRWRPARPPCSTPSAATIARSEIASNAARPCRSVDAADRARARAQQSRFCRARPHRSHHRTRQFHRACASASPRRAALRSPPASRQSGCRHWRRSPRHYRRRRHVAGGGGDRCAPRPRLSASVRRPAAAPGCTAHSAIARSIAACRRPARRASSATRPNLLAAAWPAGEPRRASVEQRSAPDIEWVARLGAAATEHRNAAEAALSARARRPAAGRSAAGPPMIGFFSSLFARGEPALSEAQRARRGGDGGAACGVVPARLERTGGRGPAARPPCHRAPRHDGRAARRLHHVAAGRGRSGESVGRGCANASVAADLRAGCSILHLRRLAGLARARYFWKSTSTTLPALRLYRARRISRGSRRRPITIREPGGKTAPALVLRRDLID